ncbi:hypothetical protein PILCRDRAFT_517297 [Piloderma croceum F 1598]|uniref:Uncharacterized protein n=1 Tax=Piloderma croceum (strain F 1598) TaxID=765440 RepID=A0A0C3BTY4_PILCF|nr:hypothetical protein PILCRDRAFT_517297 [Piloderma croceum F 1598]
MRYSSKLRLFISGIMKNAANAESLSRSRRGSPRPDSRYSRRLLTSHYVNQKNMLRLSVISPRLCLREHHVKVFPEGSCNDVGSIGAVKSRHVCLYTSRKNFWTLYRPLAHAFEFDVLRWGKYKTYLWQCLGKGTYGLQ